VPTLPSSPRLRRILLAYTVNQMGTWFAYVALSVSVYDHTHSAIAVAGMFIAARLLPALATPALVARLEASTRHGELSRLYLLEAATAAALAVLLWHFWLPGVLMLVVVDGTAALAAGALLRALVAQIAVEEITLDPDGACAEDEQVETAQREANAALNIVFTTTVAIGPIVAGLVVGSLGGSTALLIDAASFFGCGVLLLRYGMHAEAGEASLADRLKAAWEHLRAVSKLRSLLLAEALGIVFFAAVEPVEVIFARSTLHSGDGGFGLLVGSWGVGMIFGGLLFARAVKRPLPPLLIAGTFLIGFSDVGTAAAPTLAVACIISVVGGVGNGLQWPALISAVQRMTPPELQGRLMSAVEAIGAICPAIGFALGGAITAVSSPRFALFVAGLAAIATTGLFLRITAGGLPLDNKTAISDGESMPNVGSPESPAAHA
jgi:MFS family permease